MSEHTETWREEIRPFIRQFVYCKPHPQTQRECEGCEADTDAILDRIAAEISRRDAEWEAGVRGVVPREKPPMSLIGIGLTFMTGWKKCRAEVQSRVDALLAKMRGV